MEKIFITGASGCIGHYVIDQLLTEKDVELHLLMRNPKRCRFDYKQYPQIVIHEGSMEKIEALEPVICQMTKLIHIATDWSDSDYSDY